MRLVTPAKAGVQIQVMVHVRKPWIPVFTGMTEWVFSCHSSLSFMAYNTSTVWHMAQRIPKAHSALSVA